MAITTEVAARITADTSNYVRSMRAATDATNQFAAALPQAGQAQDRVKASTVALGSALGTIGAQIGMKAVGAIQKYATQGIMAAAQYEQTVISMQGIFQGSGMSMQDAAAKTQSYLAELRDFAARTPFELPQTLDAVKRLLSIGYAADDVKNRLLPTIGDMVSALGAPPQAISAVVYAFGQMKSAGRVLSQDLMQIGNALPGFNAKAALANELFGGSFTEMTKAMESGSLDSSKAIDVLITAMQKFPGAAGAMERQSGSLNGVISTFKDTVNNALIDGITPAIPALSGALTQLIPVVDSLAKGFGSNLGPMLVKGTEIMSAFAPIVSSVLPPLFELVSATDGLVTILHALAPLATAIGAALGFIAQGFNMLPGPVKNIIAVLIAFKLLISRLPFDFTMMATTFRTQFSLMGVSAGAFKIRMFEAMIATETQFGALVAGARVMAVGIAGAFRAAGAAAKGLMASIGPVGWAILAVSVAMEVFMGRTDSANEEMKAFSETLTFVNGKLDENSRKLLANKLQQDGVLDALKAAGIASNEYIDAVIKGGPELQRMSARLDAIEKSGYKVVAAGRAVQGYLTDQARGARVAADYIGGLSVTLDEAANAAKNVEEAVKPVNDVLKQATISTEEYSKAAIEQAERQWNVTRAQKAMNAAGKQYIATFKAINALLDKDSAKDNVIAGWGKLSAAIKKSGGSLSRYTEKGRAARAAFRDQMQNILALGESMKNPEKRAAFLTRKMQEMRTQLGKMGLSGSEIDKIVGPYEKQSDALKKSLKKAHSAADEAKQTGADVATSLTQSLIDQLESGQPAVNAAAYASGMQTSAAFKAGANNGGVYAPQSLTADSAYRSRAAETGKGFVNGGGTNYNTTINQTVYAQTPAEALAYSNKARRLATLDRAVAS